VKKNSEKSRAHQNLKKRKTREWFWEGGGKGWRKNKRSSKADVLAEKPKKVKDMV